MKKHTHIFLLLTLYAVGVYASTGDENKPVQGDTLIDPNKERIGQINRLKERNALEDYCSEYYQTLTVMESTQKICDNTKSGDFPSGKSYITDSFSAALNHFYRDLITLKEQRASDTTVKHLTQALKEALKASSVQTRYKEEGYRKLARLLE